MYFKEQLITEDVSFRHILSKKIIFCRDKFMKNLCLEKYDYRYSTRILPEYPLSNLIK